MIADQRPGHCEYVVHLDSPSDVEDKIMKCTCGCKPGSIPAACSTLRCPGGKLSAHTFVREKHCVVNDQLLQQPEGSIMMNKDTHLEVSLARN